MRGSGWAGARTLAVAAALALAAAGGGAASSAASAWQIVPSPNATANDSLAAVAAVSPSSLWAVGTAFGANSTSAGLIEHFNGTAWATVASPAPSGARQVTLTGVSAASASDAWAVGFDLTSRSHTSPVTEHWDGSSWSLVPAPQNLQLTGLSAVAEASASDVWAVGDDSSTTATGPPLIEHFDGSSWSIAPTPVTTAGSLSAVTAISASDVWAVGSQPSSGAATQSGLILHFDGTAWAQVPLPAPPVQSGGLWNLSAISATSASDIWAAGFAQSADGMSDHVIAEHFNGTSWSATQLPDLSSSFPFNTPGAVDAISPSSVWIIGLAVTGNGHTAPLAEHFDGTSWQVAAAPADGTAEVDLTGLASTSTGQLWAVGESIAAGSSDAQTLTARNG